jgi:hypothetical protein
MFTIASTKSPARNTERGKDERAVLGGNERRAPMTASNNRSKKKGGPKVAPLRPGAVQDDGGSLDDSRTPPSMNSTPAPSNARIIARTA